MEEDKAKFLRYKALELMQRDEFHVAKIGDLTHSIHNESIRTDKIYWLDSSSIDIGYFWETITQIKAFLNKSLFLGLDEFEVHFAFYQAGSFYRKHVDQFKTKKNRKISFVYYLNQNWQENFGGELLLYNEQNKLIKSILPTWNRFICFLSHIPHEVNKTKENRLSITGWMKTKEHLPI